MSDVLTVQVRLVMTVERRLDGERAMADVAFIRLLTSVDAYVT